MKKITFIAFSLLLSVGFAQNYVDDSNFADGTAANWTEANPGTGTGYDATDTHLADASGCYVVYSNGGWNSQIQQVVPGGDLADATETYTIKYWVKGAAGIQTQCFPFNGANVPGTIYTIQNADTWELVEELYTFDGTKNVNIKLVLKSNVSTNSVKFDDVSLEVGNTLSTPTAKKDLFSVFPTVTSNYLTIASKEGKNIEKAEFYSISGQKIKTLNLIKDITQINVSDLSNGIYLLRAYSNTESSVIKFVKN